MVIEAAWEILENSPIIIDRYREATIALGYTGDCVINSAADVIWMIARLRHRPAAAGLGDGRARARLRAADALVVIRDNLTLNVLMLVWPIDAIRVWQGGV